MADPPFLLKPKRLSLTAQPAMRHGLGDDIFAYLSPTAAVAALSQSTGALRGCLDGASAAERDFVMRTAIASQKICEWTDELSQWDWPIEGGSSGFESPNNTSRRLSFQTKSRKTDGHEYIGSLPVRALVAFEKRIEEIQRDVDDLAVEDIKSHIMTNHILPLSRPGTPLSVSSVGMYSILSYTKMDDLSAIATGMVVQMLPNLARLSHLLRAWSLRFSVLQRIPSLLFALEDAEVGLQAGWNAISKPTRRSIQVDDTGAVVPKLSLKQSDFEIMKKVIVQKVAAPGCLLDSMLDCLEGMNDTLPEAWLDRMEAIERNYGEWVASCEARITESAWSNSPRSHESPEASLTQDVSEIDNNNLSSTPDKLPENHEISAPSPSGPLITRSGNGVVREGGESRLDKKCTPVSDPTSHIPDLSQPSEDQEPKTPSDHGSFDPELTDDSFIRVDQSFLTDVTDSRLEEDRSNLNRTMTPVDEEAEEEEEIHEKDVQDEVDLPLLKGSARSDSDASEGSMLETGDTSQFDMLSSDLPDVSASPPLPRDRIREAQFMDSSPPSSPPLPKGDTRRFHDELLNRPTITSATEHDESIFNRNPSESSFVDVFDDDSLSVPEAAGSSFRRESTGDSQLRQQISEIIESIPAKIKLSAEPPAINLNPPDLQLPRLRKQSSKDQFKRSVSSLSSRVATPSFTLSPARGSRPRPTRGQQDIKVYNLYRSNTEPPIKLFIRCVGEHGERVMVRVGGGWADLSEYLKEYVSHHGRRSANGKGKVAKIEIHDAPHGFTPPVFAVGSSPPNRPASAAGTVSGSSPIAPLNVRKARRSVGASHSEMPKLRPKTPSAAHQSVDAPSPEIATRSRSGSRLSWVEDDSSFLGLAGPTGKKKEMSEENKAWVESVKERVRQVSGEKKMPAQEDRNRFGELGTVGGTKRLFRKPAGK